MSNKALKHLGLFLLGLLLLNYPLVRIGDKGLSLAGYFFSVWLLLIGFIFRLTRRP